MKQVSDVGLADVQEIYSGAVGDLWELVMGEQIHMGGLASSMDLYLNIPGCPSRGGE